MDNSKRKVKVKKNVIFMMVLFVLVVIGLIFVIKTLTKNKNELIGMWTTDGNTVYQFDEDYTGKLIVPLSEYKFTYKVDGDKLSIDFENEKSTDVDCNYSIKDGKLILENFNGNTYTFTRK